MSHITLKHMFFFADQKVSTVLFFREHIICDIWFNYTKNILHTRHEKVAKVFLLHFLISSYVAVGAADTLQNVKKK